MILYAVCGGVSDTDSMFTVQRVIAKRKCYSGVFTNRLSATFVKLAVRCSSIVMLSPPPLEKSEECHLMRNGRCVMYSHRRMKRERKNMWCIWKRHILNLCYCNKPRRQFHSHGRRSCYFRVLVSFFHEVCKISIAIALCHDRMD